MKMKRPVLWCCLAALLLSAVLPFRAEAATKNKYVYTVHALKAKQTVTTKEYTGNYVGGVYTITRHVYKITIPADGYITLKLDRVNGNNSSIYLGKSQDCYDAETYLTDVWLSSAKQSEKIALQKGTYYLYSTRPCKMSYTFTKASIGTNYCAAKAVSLKANKNAVVIAAGSNSFGHWYKINLTSNKKLTFIYDNMGNGSHDICIYNENHKYQSDIYLTGDSGSKKTDKTYKKGVYYLYIPCGYYSKYSDAFTFKWK